MDRQTVESWWMPSAPATCAVLACSFSLVYSIGQVIADILTVLVDPTCSIRNRGRHSMALGNHIVFFYDALDLRAPHSGCLNSRDGF